MQAIVVSNTGRTGDTIVGMGRAGDGDAMVLRTPEFDAQDACVRGLGHIG